LRLWGAGWSFRAKSACAEEHGGVFENRIEDRKPLRVLFCVLRMWDGIQNNFSTRAFFPSPELRLRDWNESSE
jgi:hypothetical protein